MKEFEKLVLTGAVAAVAGAGLGIAYTEQAVEAVRSDPPVAVMTPEDWLEEARSTMPDGAGEARRKAHLEQAVRNMRRAADRLSQAGYIVLDGAQVLAAPENFEIKADSAVVSDPDKDSQSGKEGKGSKSEAGAD